MRDKKLIYWISMPTEVEYDIYMLSKLTKKFDIRICNINNITNNDKRGLGKEINHPYKIDINFESYDKCSAKKDDVILMLKRIANENPDLVIKKGGWASMVSGTTGELSKIMDANNIKNCIWCCEQGNMREWQMEQCKPFNWVVVNNKEDEIYYKQQFPNKKINYMPFGCVPEFHKKTNRVKEYESLISSYSMPKLETKEKLESYNTLIKPLKDFFNPDELALYGYSNWYPNDMKDYIRCLFPYKNFSEVNSSCDIVLGITSNAKTGGYGTKLAKMLSCGTFVLWHYTKGIENDFENHKHLVWSKNAWQTVLLTKYYLSEPEWRNKIALEGQKYAHEHLSYEKNIMKLLEEI